MTAKPFRLLLDGGKTRRYATVEARDAAAQDLADETGAWVGLEKREDGQWWLERVVRPS
jgi:hypothetical protein